MVDGADADGWSQVADGWAELWGSFADPARRAIIEAAAIGPGTRVLDAGCGSGEFLRLLAAGGADAVGADPAPAMVALAREAGAGAGGGAGVGAGVGAGADVVLADIENLPFADASFDVATAVNALQFADDTTAAVRELARVVRPGGLVAVSNWAEAALNDIDVVEAAIAEARDDEPYPDGPLRPAGGIEAALAAGGLEVVRAGVVDAPWLAADADALVRGILLGEDAEVMASMHPVIVAAAAPFADGQGGYLLRNSFRWAVARVFPGERVP